MVSEKNCKLKDKQTGRLTDRQIDEQMRVKQYNPPPPPSHPTAEIQKGEKTLKFTEITYENYQNNCF